MRLRDVGALEGESKPIKAGGRARRFIGEDESTDDLKEVATWINVYSELAQFCERAMAEASGGSASSPLEDWRDHFNLRLAHWQRRRDEIEQIS